MKKSKQSSHAKHRKPKPISKGGKRSLYRPELGSSNWRKAQDGRFTLHPAFRACRQFQGAYVAIQRMTSDVKRIEQRITQIALRLEATEIQMDKALLTLSVEAERLKSPSDKLRFAEAIAVAFFNRTPGMRDERVLRVCWREIQMRTTLHEKPSQAELRHAVEREDGIKLSDEEWKRLLKRTGLNKKLPTQREKLRGLLRRV